MEELDLIMNDRIIQNRVSKFSNGVVAKDSEIRNMYIDLSHIISDYLDAENRMFHVATIGKLLVGLVTIIGTIIINQIKLIINLI